MTEGSGNKVEDFEKADKKTKKLGQPYNYDPDFNGPTKNRSCTDVICLILYGLFALISIAIALFAFSRSNPLLLIYPTDSRGELCGYGRLESKPYLHFFDLLQCVKNLPKLVVSGCPTTQICVEECPSRTWSYLSLQTTESVYGADPAVRRQQLLCLRSVNHTDQKWLSRSVASLVEDGYCAPYLVPETPVMHRCVPKFIIDSLNGIANSVNPNTTLVDSKGKIITMDALASSRGAFNIIFEMQSYAEKCLADLRSSWRHIVVFVAIALFLSFLWVILLRIIVCPLVWTTIILFVILWFCATLFALWKYNTLANIVQEPEQLKALASLFAIKTNITATLTIPGETSDIWLAVTIICGVVLLVLLLMLCFLGSRINLAIRLFEETSIALGHMPTTLLWPVFPFCLQAVTIGWAGAAAVCLATLGKPQFANSQRPGLLPLPESLTACDFQWAVKASADTLTNAVSRMDSLINSTVVDISSLNKTTIVANANSSLSDVCRFVKYDAGKYSIYLQIYNLFMFFWTYNFVSGFGMTVLAGSFASYYWAFRKPKDIPMIPLLSSLWRTTRYHIGSIAFGSLLIALVQIIRVILDYVMYKLKQQKNDVAAFLVKCVDCCFSCLERAVKFIARKAYIMVAVHGKNFCTSAMDAWQLIARNAIRAVVLTGVSRFIVIVSKLIICGSVITLSYFYFHGEIPAAIPDLVPTWPILNFFYVPIIVVAVGSFAVASISLHVYEVGVETTFLCFLEDCERNDGSNERPYYMSKNLACILR